MDLSIVIPIYNTPIEKLSRCFDSILQIKGIKYEVYLIDDGSKESIGKYCKKISQENTVFHYFYKENGGVSSARNTGIELAGGEFICFIDSDDMIIAQGIQKTDLLCQADVIIYDMLVKEKGKEVIWKSIDCNSGFVPVEEILREISKSSNLNSPCAKLFKREFLLDQQIRFDTSMKTGEDLNFFCDLVQNGANLFYKKSIIYYYFREMETSQQRVFKFPEIMISNYVMLCEKIRVMIKESELQSSEKVELINVITSRQIGELYNYASDMFDLKILNSDRKKLLLEALYNIIPECTEIVSLKTKIKYWCLKNEKWKLISLIAYLRKFYLEKIK